MRRQAQIIYQQMEKSGVNGTVKGGICSLIEAVSWSWKVWNYAFYHYIRIYNLTPQAHGVPYTNVTGKLADLSLMQIFGCPVMV